MLMSQKSELTHPTQRRRVLLTTGLQVSFRMSGGTVLSFPRGNKHYLLLTAAFQQASEDTHHGSPPSSKLLLWLVVPTAVPRATGTRLRALQLVGVPRVMWTPRQKPSGAEDTGTTGIKLPFFSTHTPHCWTDTSLWLSQSLPMPFCWTYQNRSLSYYDRVILL